MKKLLILLLSALSLTAFAQQKKVAVYIIGQQSGITKVLGDQLVVAFAKSGKYAAVERTNSFLAELSKEQNYQRSGAVNDNDIARLGVQFGVNYVCVADMSDVFGEKYISARLIDVETAVVLNAHNVSGKMSSMDECLNMASEIANYLSKGTFKEQQEAEKKQKEEEIRRKQLEAEQERLQKQREEEARMQAKQNRPWTDLLEKVGKNVSYRYLRDIGWYIGRWCDNKCGRGINYAHGKLECGNFDNGSLDGFCMEINVASSYGISNVRSSAWAYVGDFKNDKKSGEGTLYDKSGKLIYYGKFFNDKPTGNYVSDNSYDSYTFQVINYKNGDKYIGELKDGQKHGRGLYIFESGDAWYGRFQNDERNGYGIYAFYSGSYSKGKWLGNKKIE